MKNPEKEPYQVTNEDIADAASNMTDAKWKSSNERSRIEKDLESLLKAREMDKKDLNRIDVDIIPWSVNPDFKKLTGTVVGKDGVKHNVSVTYRLKSGGFFVISELSLDRSSISLDDNKDALVAGQEFLKQWVPIIPLLKERNSHDLDRDINTEQQVFEEGKEKREADLQKQKEVALIKSLL